MTMHRFCQRAKLSVAVAVCFAVSAAMCANVSAQQTQTENAVEENQPATTTKKEKKKREPTRVIRSLGPVDGYESVEMFQAIADGQIEVRLIPRDATECTIKVENKSDKPLAIQMPEAFAGVPVLAQAGLGGGQGGGGQGAGGGGGQGVGGGFGGGGGGRQGGGGGGGLFNIPPGKTGRVKITTFCLDHEKKDPKPRDEYVIKPLTDYCDDPEIAEICKMVAYDRVAQPIAQAVAWNIANDVTWEELLNKERRRYMTGHVDMFFSRDQVAYAYEVATATIEYVEEMEKQSKSTSQQGNESSGERYNR